MMRQGVYGYYAIDEYPWVLNCLKDTLDESFSKTAPVGGQGRGPLPPGDMPG